MFHTEQFFQYLAQERRVSKHTLLAYTADLEQFTSFCKDIQCLTSVTEVGHLHIRAWIVLQMESGQSPRSINRRLSCLKTYFKYLIKRSLLQKDPMKKVIAPKTGKRLPVIIQEREMVHLFEGIVFPAGYKGGLHRIVLEILYATGIRRGELAQLRVSDLDFSRRVIRILGKGDKERFVPMAAYLSHLLEGFVELRTSTFPATQERHLLLNFSGAPLHPQSIYQIVNRYLSLVSSAEQRSPHVLRHSFATHLSNAGADLNAIKEILGHSSLAATQVYTHNSIQQLKKVYDQAHPKSEKEDDVSDET